MEVIGYETITCKCGHERTVEIRRRGKRTRYPDLCWDCKKIRIRQLHTEWRRRVRAGTHIPKTEFVPADARDGYIPPPQITASYVQDLQGSRLIETLNRIARGQLAITGVR